MTLAQKKRFCKQFYHRAGQNVETFKAMFDTLRDDCFYIKDRDGRIVALNRRNCENCNIRDEMDAVGMRSCDLFPDPLAHAYMQDDTIVLSTKKPLIGVRNPYPSDQSSSFEVKNIFPIRDRNGAVIGVACVYRHEQNPEKVPSWHGLMKIATRHMSEHYRERLSLTMLAQSMHMSTSKFTRLFTKTLGTTPGKYLTDIRITAARTLLETTSKTLVEIAQESGFYDLSHFSRTFAKARGMTPGKYRKQHLSIGTGTTAVS